MKNGYEWKIETYAQTVHHYDTVLAGGMVDVDQSYTQYIPTE